MCPFQYQIARIVERFELELDTMLDGQVFPAGSLICKVILYKYVGRQATRALYELDPFCSPSHFINAKDIQIFGIKLLHDIEDITEQFEFANSSQDNAFNIVLRFLLNL